MTIRILSLDIATTTGWSFVSSDNMSEIKRGLIKTNNKFSLSKRLSNFREELTKLLELFKPSHVVIEDIFSGLNVNTMKLLAKYAGVAQECCMTISNIEPYIIHTSTVKAYFKAKDKQDVFNIVIDIIDWTDSIFKRDNDITDAIAQLLCYYDEISEGTKYRFKKEYGYLYKIGVNNE